MLGKYLELKKIIKDAKKDAPVFIIGKARSGTSILYKTLLRHSTFIAAKTSLTESKVFDYSNRAYLFNFEKNHSGRQSTAYEYMMQDDQSYHRFLDLIEPIVKIHQLTNRIFPEQFSYHLCKSTMLWKLYLNHLVVSPYFHFAAKSRGANRLLEKTPNNFWNIDKIRYIFPKSKLLFIYRHPIDTYTSYVRRNQIEHGKYAGYTPQKFCLEYKIELFFVQRHHRKTPEGLKLIKYEDFVLNPEHSLHTICKFIGENFEPSMLNEPQNENNNWKADPYLFKKISAKTKNWEEFINVSDGKFIEKSLSAVMKQLGYSNYF